MPYLKIETNTLLDKDFCRKTILAVSRELAGLLGKPEEYTMVSLLPDVSICFAGTTQPAAYLELKAIGLAEEQCAPLAADLCRIVQSNLGIAQDRIYIEFKDLDARMFGWNGQTF